MSSGETFNDPHLKQALAREAERLEVDPRLRASVEALFAGAGKTPEVVEPKPIRMFPNRSWLLAAAAVVIAGLSIAFFTLRPEGEEDEYLVAEARLWPAMASLYRADATPTTSPALTPAGDVPVLTDPRYSLVALRNDKIDTVDCQVRDYRRDDGVTLSVITTPAKNLLREPEEESDERYDETVGAIRIVGGIKDDYWVCVAAPKTVSADVFEHILDSVKPAAK